MNQAINAPTSFVSFRKLETAPTIPKQTASASTTPASTTASTPINPNDYMVNIYDYIPLAVGLGVIYVMIKY